MVYDMIYPFNVGGAEERNYLLAKELIRIGHEVHFFGAKLWKGKDIIVHDDIVMHGVYTSKGLYKKSKRTYIEPIIFALKLKKHLFKEDFDVVDCTAFPYFSVFTSKWFANAKKIPFVITWHEVWDDYWKGYVGFVAPFARWIERKVAKLTKTHISVSDRTKKRLLAINPNAKVDVVPNAIDFDLIDAIKPAKERFDLIYCGRLMPHKNVDYILKAVTILKHDFSNVSCLIVGKGPEKERLLQLTKRLDIENNVTFKDFLPDQKDVYALMKSSKIFVSPSILEGFGIVVIEAMACGLPIIGVSHKWNAAEDVINENKAGFVVKLSAEAIAEKVSFLLKRKSSYNQIVGNNLQKCRKYEIEKIAKKIESIYKKLK